MGVTEACVGILHGVIHRVHDHFLSANHRVLFAEAFQAQLTLESQHASFLLDNVLKFDKKLTKKVVSTHQKVAASQHKIRLWQRAWQVLQLCWAWASARSRRPVKGVSGWLV